MYSLPSGEYARVEEVHILKEKLPGKIILKGNDKSLF